MIELIYHPIDISKIMQSVADVDCGATVLFTGSTRRLTGSQITSKLSYEAHESMAASQLQQLLSSAKSQWPVRHVAISHRLGEVPVGEISVAVAVSSPHREASFLAAKWLIDTLKKEVPIWKQDFETDGSSTWIHPPQNETV